MRYLSGIAVRRAGAVTVLAVAGVALAMGVPTAASAADSTVDMVALGDSYAAGVGAGAESGACRRTGGAYATLWAKTAEDRVSQVLAACSGASSADVLAKQMDKLNDGTDLVTVTVGSNDLGLVEALKMCADPSQAQACAVKLAEIQTAVGTTLPAGLAKMFAGIAAKAPKAKLVVTGYPLPFAAGADCPGLPLSPQARAAGNGLVGALNTVLAAQSKALGATYVDVSAIFAGHELCTTAPWLVGVEGLTAQTVLHPTLKGQTDGYLAAIVSQVGTPQDILEWIDGRDRPAPSTSPASPVPAPSQTSAVAAPGTGGGEGLPVTGPNIWLVVGAGVLLIALGTLVYRMLRPTTIRVTAE